MVCAQRIHCCVPGCRRSFRADRCRGATEIVCGRCVQLADKKLQERWAQLRRRERKCDRLFRRLPTIKWHLQSESRRRRGYNKSAAYLEAIFWKASTRAANAVIADATIKLAMGADGAPTRRRAA